MYKRYSVILFVISIWLLQNAVAGISFGGCCQQKGAVCNCSKEPDISCGKISESYCDVACVKEVPITSSPDENNTNRVFRNAYVDITGIIPILNLLFLATSNNCPEYTTAIIQPCLYLGQSHYRSPPIN